MIHNYLTQSIIVTHGRDSFEESLRAHKFLEPKKAWKNYYNFIKSI